MINSCIFQGSKFIWFLKLITNTFWVDGSGVNQNILNVSGLPIFFLDHQICSNWWIRCQVTRRDVFSIPGSFTLNYDWNVQFSFYLILWDIMAMFFFVLNLITILARFTDYIYSNQESIKGLPNSTKFIRPCSTFRVI